MLCLRDLRILVMTEACMLVLSEVQAAALPDTPSDERGTSSNCSTLTCQPSALLGVDIVRLWRFLDCSVLIAAGTAVHAHLKFNFATRTTSCGKLLESFDVLPKLAFATQRC